VPDPAVDALECEAIPDEPRAGFGDEPGTLSLRGGSEELAGRYVAGPAKEGFQLVALRVVPQALPNARHSMLV
jgi:hypothetical protein